MPRYGVLNQSGRQAEKAEARRADAEDLRLGAREVSASRSKKS